MVNFKKLADRAKLARTIVDQQGGTEGLKKKVDKLRDVAMSSGTVGERAKAAASVAREKPTPKPTRAVGAKKATATKAAKTKPATTGAAPTGRRSDS